jgi:hypothetical protein
MEEYVITSHVIGCVGTAILPWLESRTLYGIRTLLKDKSGEILKFSTAEKTGPQVGEN